MGTRVEQSGEFLPCAGRAGCRHVEDLADSLHRLSPTAEDLQIIILRRNRPLLLQGDFCISLNDRIASRKICLMRYSNAQMTGSVSQAASGAATVGSRTALSGAVSDLILAVTERQIAPGETACFPFVARTAYGIPSIHEFNVISDNPNFNPEWVRLGQSAGHSSARTT